AIPPSSASPQRSEGAVAGVRLVGAPLCPGRNQLHRDVHEGLAGFVPAVVPVAGWFEKARPGRQEMWRAGGIVREVIGRGAGRDDEKARPWVAVPAERPARINRDLYDVEIRHALGLDLGLPLTVDGLGLDLAERCPGKKRRVLP